MLDPLTRLTERMLKIIPQLDALRIALLFLGTGLVAALGIIALVVSLALP